jgi:sarcosine oxidase/L-pipecolate oxidase
MAATPFSFLILGAGVFGASTALALAQSYPSKSIVLIDREIPSRRGASWDWTKVIRADYTDIFYTRLAVEAKRVWRSNPLYSGNYHETGLVWVDDSGFSKGVIENYSALGVDEKWELVSAKDLRASYGGSFSEAEFGNLQDIFLNKSSGWVEASKALANVIEAAASAGVQLIESEACNLMFDDGGSGVGVRTTDGQVFLGEKIILATGAETAKILVTSAPDLPQLHVGSRLSAAGLITGVLNLDAEEAIRHHGTPVFLHAGGPAQGNVKYALRMAIC